MRPVVRKRILERDNNACRKCGNTKNLHIDHIIPLCRGGFEDESNMQVLCRTCNLSKGKGIDLDPYIRLGTSPDSIEIRPDFPIKAFTSTEFKLILIWLWERNDRIFGIERSYEYAQDKRRLLHESSKDSRKRNNARSATC